MARTLTARLLGYGATVALLLAGCGGPGQEEPTEPVVTPPAPRRSTSERPSTTPAPTTSQEPTRTARPRSTAPPRQTTPKRCEVTDLTVTLRGDDGAAGTIYRELVFTNTGRRTCTIQGFPGVSFVGGDDGHQVGQAAAWDGQAGPVVKLRPRAEATAVLAFPNIDNYDPTDCVPTPVRGMRVYPPHDTKSEFVSFETTACAGTPPGNHLRVRSVQAGSSLG